MIDTWKQWWEAHFVPLENGHTRWIPTRQLVGQMTPRFRGVYERAQRRLANSQNRGSAARRYVYVATRKYRARKRRR